MKTLSEYVEWDLEKIIEDMIKEFSNVQNVYLFGSRGYKTNSYRSDIDLLVAFDGTPQMVDLKKFREKYSPIDIFLNYGGVAVSFVNGSTITLREDKYESIFVQLDAIRLWDNQDGFDLKNKGYYKQKTFADAEFFPSLFVETKVSTIIMDVVHREPQATRLQKQYLREAVACYNHDCNLGFISMLGAFYEDLLIDLASKYSQRVQSAFPNLINDYTRNVLNNSLSSKKRLEALYEFVKNNDERYYKSNGLGSVSELYMAFDVIRKYRNEVDHPDPNSETFDKVFCDALISPFKRYVPTIYRIMASI